MGFELTVSNAPGYLRRRGIAPDAELTVESLSGGISNIVIRAVWNDGCVVIKQSRAQLKVADRWEFSRARIFGERDCMAFLGRLLPEGSVPQVVFSDDEDFIFGMSCAPAGGRNWKHALLAGEVDERTASRAGHLLGRIHGGAAGDREIAQRFDDLSPLIQGRVDPYHRTVMAAHPDLATAIEAEVQRLLATRTTLVLGDYSPKNIIVYPESLLLLDFEVAHWGDPAFDVAFLLTHLILKAVRCPPLAAAYASAARCFLEAYDDAAGGIGATGEPVVRELGCLLLSRVDGKSKAEYITSDAQRSLVRALGRAALLGNDTEPRSVVDSLVRQIQEPAHASISPVRTSP